AARGAALGRPPKGRGGVEELPGVDWGRERGPRAGEAGRRTGRRAAPRLLEVGMSGDQRSARLPRLGERKVESIVDAHEGPASDSNGMCSERRVRVVVGQLESRYDQEAVVAAGAAPPGGGLRAGGGGLFGGGRPNPP